MGKALERPLLPGPLLLRLGGLGAVIIGRQSPRLGQPECLLEKPAGLLAPRSGKAVGLNAAGAVTGDNHFDRVGVHHSPPALSVSLTAPPASGCSLTE